MDFKITLMISFAVTRLKTFISFRRDFIKCRIFYFFSEKNYCRGIYALSFALLLFLCFYFFCDWTSTRHKQNDKITPRMRKSWVFERRLLLLKCVVDFSLVVSSFSLRGSIWNGIKHTSIYFWEFSKIIRKSFLKQNIFMFFFFSLFADTIRV